MAVARSGGSLKRDRGASNVFRSKPTDMLEEVQLLRWQSDESEGSLLLPLFSVGKRDWIRIRPTREPSSRFSDRSVSINARSRPPWCGFPRMVRNSTEI